ncbi:MAG: MerR family transcriptional regulator [Crocinitomix sp.]|nr:MerR family transcriptional regulator [Crocinitomix sp.]
MGVYSIKDLENFTQIKAHTLRIWEQRYNLLSPERTDTNIRLYSDRDLKKILNINLLYSNGLKISKIAKLNENEIFRLANEILLVPDGEEVSNVDRFINRIIRFDEVGMNDELEELRSANSLEYVFTNLLIPVLQKVGELWQVDSITAAHEHFFSNILRAFIVRHTGPSIAPETSKGSVVLFLKEDEYHELGLLFYNHYLRSKGYHTIYLGQSLPNEDFVKVVQDLKPDYVFTSLITKLNEKEFLQFFESLASCVPLDRLFVGGYQLKIFEKLIPEKVNIIHTVDAIHLD